MRIKEVCEKTGLSDKTIRYYIRVGLVFPKYDENYTGRKNFNFEDNDIERLNQVAILRKYGFSINRIKLLIEGGENSRDIFNAHIEEMKGESEKSSSILKRLQEVSEMPFGNMYELCNLLESSEYIPASVPSDDNKKPYQIMYAKNKNAKIALIAMLVLVVVLSAVVIAFVGKSFYSATNTSIIGMSHGFAGVCVIESNVPGGGGYSEEREIQYINEIYVNEATIDGSNSFESLSITREGDVYVINAVIKSDMDYVKVVPIYRDLNLEEHIMYNSDIWCYIENFGGLTISSNKTLKGRDNFKYKYNVTINPVE